MAMGDGSRARRIIALVVLLAVMAGACSSGEGDGVVTVPSDDVLEVDSTTPGNRLQRRSYDPGDCVWWGEALAVDVLATKIVPCEEDHVLEVTGRHVITDQPGPRPDQAYWEALFTAGPCLQLAEDYLGAKLDPTGNYFPYGAIPSPESWAAGDRAVWCGIGAWPYEAERLLQPVRASRGRVMAREQYRIYPVGSCLTEVTTAHGKIWGVVPCDSPHLLEVAAHLDRSGQAQPPSEGADADDCDRAAASFVGGRLRPPVRSGGFAIEPESWEAGRRTVVCTVSEYVNDERQSITHSLGK